jgi:HPt (histidine-containing phosphotransfer) domain-containing protein
MPPEVVEAARKAKEMMKLSGAYGDSGPPVPHIFSRGIDGLDIYKGLERYEGNVDTYLKLLRYYTANISSMLAEIEPFREEEINSYRITVHGIKGASYDIYADRIGELAEALENASKNGDIEYIRGHNPVFLEAAGILISNISDMLAAIEAENPKPIKSKPDEHLLMRLLSACNDYDMDEANETMEEIERYRYESDGGLVDWLRENVDRMDFKQIIERLS